jgi:hypothetical protein
MYQEGSLLHHVNNYQKKTTFKLSMHDQQLFADAVNHKKV